MFDIDQALSSLTRRLRLPDVYRIKLLVLVLILGNVDYGDVTTRSTRFMVHSPGKKVALISSNNVIPQLTSVYLGHDQDDETYSKNKP